MKFTVHFLFFLFLGLQFTSCSAQRTGRSRINKEDRIHFAETEFSEGMKAYILGKPSEALVHFEESEKLGGENAALHYMYAQIYLDKDKADLALQHAAKALKEDPKNKYYYLLVAMIYERKQDYTEAAKTYKRLIAEVPKSEEYYYELAEIYYNLKNYDEALKAYDKIETYFGKSLPLTQRKQELYLRQGNVDAAQKEGEALVEAFPDVPEYKIALAQFLFRNKMAEKATPLLEEVLKNDPENSEARILLSDIYKMQGNSAKSEKELEAVFNSPETDIEAKLNIVAGYLKAKDTKDNRDQALRLSESIVKTHPEDPRSYSIYGESLRRSGKKTEALESFIRSKNIDNTNFPVWMEILTIDADLGKGDSLVKHSEEALENFPNQSVFWMYKGLGYSMEKSYKEAVEALEEGRKLAGNNPDLNLQFNIQLGDNYNYLGNHSKSDAAYEEALKIDRDNEHALNNYSYFLSLRKEKLEQAKSMSEKLMEKYPDNPAYLDTHAWVLYQMKDYKEAKKYLEKALLNSSDGTIIEHYGDVLFQLGEKDKAVEQWKNAKKQGDASDKIDKKIADKKLYE